jgi:preprotein translocase subunit SecD
VQEGLDQDPVSTRLRALPVLVPKEPRSAFGSGDFHGVEGCFDSLGYPALHFELVEERQRDFREFTATLVNCAIAITLNEKLLSAPKIAEPLPGSGIIRGEFTDEDVRELLTVLREGRAGPLTPIE